MPTTPRRTATIAAILSLLTLGCTRCSGIAGAGAAPVASSVSATNPTPLAFPEADSTPGPSGAPVIQSFTASPLNLRLGEATTLSWSVNGATHVGLSPYGTVTARSVSVKPAATLTYVLAATNKNGTSTVRLVVQVTRSVAPRTLRVAPNGNDANADGSPRRPYSTVQKAVDLAEPGDTVMLASGSYSGAVRIRKPSITLTSAPGAWAVIESPYAEGAPGAVLQIDPEAHGCKLSRLEVVGGASYGIFLQTTWDWGDPVRRTGPGHVLIEDCYIHDTGRDAIKVTPATDDVTVRRCTIARTGRRDPSNADGIDNVNGDRMLVEETWIHDVATNGIYFKGGSIGSRIERSLVTDAGGAGILLGFDTSPEFFDKDVNPEYFDCLDCVARNNIVARTAFAGIGFFASLRGQAVHNTIVDAGQKGQSAVHFGVVLHDWEKEIPCPGSRDAVFANNIVVQSATAIAPMVQVRYSEDNGGVSGLQGNLRTASNRYYRQGGTATFSDKRPASRFDGTLVQWQAHLDGDRGSVEGDPGLDALLHLAQGSPCIDKAQPGLAEDDYDGAPRQGRPDLGADEAGQGPSLEVPPLMQARGTGRN